MVIAASILVSGVSAQFISVLLSFTPQVTKQPLEHYYISHATFRFTSRSLPALRGFAVQGPAVRGASSTRARSARVRSARDRGHNVCKTV
jgi:hypothetical protein